MEQHYIVTGGAGFIGSHIAQRLLESGYQVTIFDDLSTGKEGNINSLEEFGELNFIRGSIIDFPLLCKVFEGADGIFHEAALVSVPLSIEKPDLNHNLNTNGSFNVLNAARVTKVPRVVMASSAAAYGANTDIPHHEMMNPSPLSPYAVSKVTGEMYGRVFSQIYGIAVTSLRYFNVFGPGQDPGSPYSGVISRFMDAISHQKEIVIFGDGEQSRDFVSVHDVVSANILAMKQGEAGIYNVGTGVSTSLNSLVSMIADIRGVPVQVKNAPPRLGEVRHSCADISSAERSLGYYPRISLRSGLEELFALREE